MTMLTIAPDANVIDTYYKTLDALKLGQKVQNESGTRRAFETLLDEVGKQRKWTLVAEVSQQTATRTIRPDGVLRDEWQLPHAYWEAKDSKDDLDTEIRKKIAKGYPTDNIIFEDTERAVLYQDGQEEMVIDLRDREQLARMLTQFMNHEIEPFEKFEDAVTSYSEEIRHIAESLKQKIETAHNDKSNKQFQNQFADFMEVCRTSLNPNISQSAVDEMLIQHLMTERIIRRVFNVESFSRNNVIAREIEKVIDALTSKYFNRKDFLGALDRFYQAIEAAADKVTEWQDKQHFINTVYERFFQGYSVKVADTHGIVYTPQPIVDFMCAAVEEVLANEFGKRLGDDGVYLIDPATGTGNFIINLLERAYKRNISDREQFDRFYREQLFANEVMLMPYYIASLNIEHTYFELRQKYEPFEGICFVDTLDLAKGRQMSFSFMTEENTKRVQRQQDAPITVIIGNPPYNVGQVNENDNNKNRKYENIDKGIKATYSKDSSATNKNALSDVYVKFFRWATDRLDDRDGIVCMVTNNSFIDGLAFDGMRKHLRQDFTEIYHLDLHGNVRENPKLSGTTHNVFGIQVGVGITIAVRSKNHQKKKLFYHRVPEFWSKEQKLAHLTWNVEEDGQHNSLNTVEWEKLLPNKKNIWLVAEHDDEFNSYIPLGTKKGKLASTKEPQTVFKLFAGGIKSNRDVYVYDFEQSPLEARMKKFSEEYNSEVDRFKRANKNTKVDDFVDYTYIKWDSTLKKSLKSYSYSTYSPKYLRNSLYRPFCKRLLYFDSIFLNSIHLQHYFFPSIESETENKVIIVGGYGRKDFAVNLSDVISDLNFYADPAQTFPFYVYDEDGSNRRENITDWALAQFRQQYGDETISKWDIFYYVYGLLHHPDYRERYADNLKRELPRIPFAPSGFWEFSKAGKQLADLHLHYETGERYKLEWVIDEEMPPSFRVDKMRPKGKRDALDGNYKVYDTLQVNDYLTLKGIPEKVFAYRLGNRSALDWVVDQYQIKTDKRSGITSDPNGYSEDEQYIPHLVERVIQVSVKTVEIVEQLEVLDFRE